MAKKANQPQPAGKQPVKKAPANAATANWAQKAQQLKKKWDAYKKKDFSRPGFDNAPVPTGKHRARFIGGKIDVYKGGKEKGEFYALLRFALEDDPYTGIQVSVGPHTLSDDVRFQNKDGEDVTGTDLFLTDLTTLGVDVKSLEPHEFPQVLETLANEKPQPLVSLQIKNVVKEPDGSYVATPDGNMVPRADGGYQNVYLNARIAEE